MKGKPSSQKYPDMRKVMLSISLFALLLLLLSACGGGAAEAPANEGNAYNEPAEEPAEEVRPTPTPSAQDRIEEWIVDLEWPSEMALGESDVIRLTMLPSEQGIVIEAEFEDHQSTTRNIPIERPAGYLLTAVAEIHAPTFEVSPEGPQQRELVMGKEENWHWTITPKEAGRQRISFSLTMEWQALEGQSPKTRRFGSVSQGIEVQVSYIFGMSKSTASMVIAALIIGILILGGLAVRRSQQKLVIQIASPDANVRVDKVPEVSLSDEEGKLLQTAFRDYRRVVVEKEFMSGYSGARTFLLTPVHADEKSDARTIVKVSDQESIRREYNNYQRYVKNTLPPTTARIQQKPVARNKESIAALQYTFIGMPGETPLSLRQQLLEDQDPEWFIKLADAFGPNWWMQRHPYTFRLSEEYDRKLPAHLVIHPAGGNGKVIDGSAAPGSFNVNVGDLVQLNNFSIRSRDSRQGKISLVGNTDGGNAPLRVTVIGSYQPSKITGTVVRTRQSYLQELTADFDTHGYPDPLSRLPDLLAETVQGTRSIIHGDLNLENILVGPGNLLWLIDFAETREGHALFDFAHLYAETIAHILSRQKFSPEEYLQSLEAGNISQLQEIEEISSRYAFDPGSDREFRLAAAISCLGALKYENLESGAKYLLYLTAAYLAQTL